ncbi:nucleotidyltransferase domain-containing protein [Bacillus cereus]|uniref:nucleotidyltransferase domain-containing protein n=1 Tax=Bacillus cereus TaxID=1396 RepID=UPI000BFB4261|nr:nucleotidyltransferase [Bacillus cereus]PGY94669.1 nucleotidyltransferase [Bacillus cereus]
MIKTAEKLEKTLISWARRASDSEESKCENALKMIKDAINKSEKLSKYEFAYVQQGSYYNNTNVRLNSDVDIAVRLKNIFFTTYPEGKGHADFGNVNNTYAFSDYRNDVYEALIDKFGDKDVTLGDKCIKIRSNSYRVDADVVPCFEHRRYSNNGSYILGNGFKTRKEDELVKNYPEQHFENGVLKNNNTSRRYKRVVRILKRLRYVLNDQGYKHENISSFLIECLVWNVPNNLFNNTTYTEDIQKVLNYLIENTSTADKCKEWGEVSDLLYLFHSSKQYTRQEVNTFLNDVYKYLCE